MVYIFLCRVMLKLLLTVLFVCANGTPTQSPKTWDETISEWMQIYKWPRWAVVPQIAAAV